MMTTPACYHRKRFRRLYGFTDDSNPSRSGGVRGVTLYRVPELYDIRSRFEVQRSLSFPLRLTLPAARALHSRRYKVHQER
jgi:hypothetical protein